jgi:hypothetical protein
MGVRALKYVKKMTRFGSMAYCVIELSVEGHCVGPSISQLVFRNYVMIILITLFQMACQVVAADPAKPSIFYIRESVPLIRAPMEHLHYLNNVMLLPISTTI